jgi:putative DNA primase/helicase
MTLLTTEQLDELAENVSEATSLADCTELLCDELEDIFTTCPNCHNDTGWHVDHANGCVVTLQCGNDTCPPKHFASVVRALGRELPKLPYPVRLYPMRRFILDGSVYQLAPDAVRALVERGDDIYSHAGDLVRVTADGDMQPLDSIGLLLLLANLGTWQTARMDRDGRLYYVNADPPVKLAQTILESASWPGVRALDQVARAPMVQPGGSILTTSGYDPETRIYYVPPEALDGLVVPEDVTQADVAAALDVLWTDVLGDFPFVGDADHANALALLLLGFVRPLINGPTPMFWFDATVAGTGKGIARNCCLIPAMGEVIATRTMPSGDDEIRKGLTAELKAGARAINYDNVRGVVKSEALEAALTESYWTDRILGHTASLRPTPIQVLWTLTSNNALLGTDMKRRIVAIHLDAECELPYRRTGPEDGTVWRHTLPEWVIDNRRLVVESALTLIQWWVHAGMPRGSTGRMGSYESWEGTMRGILETAGVSGFLDNVADLDETNDPEREETISLFATWAVEIGDRAISSKQVADNAALMAIIRPHLRDGGTSAIGAFLRTHKGMAGGYRLSYLAGGRGSSGSWKVEIVADKPKRNTVRKA